MSSKDEVKKPTTSSSSSTTTSSSTPIQIRDPDEVYEYDAEAVAKQRKEKPWENNVKYFKHCRVSALAAMKMLKHALAGVEKGRRAGTNPVEVMGLMIGKAEGDTIVILDTCPLPVEGTETRVVADEAQTHMIELADSLEERRREGFVGWYHSHPFDVETYSHCHLSATDVQTQFGWQNYTPTWLAIVVDPLRSLARQEPEFGAFRCYPIKYNPPANESPDGTISTDNNERIVRWGVTHNRYYALKISYFMSGLGSQLLDVMSRNNLWVRVLSSSTIMEPENRQRFAERVRKAADKLSASENAAISSGMGMGTLRYGRGGTTKGGNEELAKGAQACCDLAIEQCKGHLSQISKDLLFNFVQRQAKREAREQAEWEATQKTTSASK